MLPRGRCPSGLPGLGTWHQHGQGAGPACRNLGPVLRQALPAEGPGLGLMLCRRCLKILDHLNKGPHLYFANDVAPGTSAQALDTSPLLSCFLNATASFLYQVCFIAHSGMPPLPLLATWAVGKDGIRGSALYKRASIICSAFSGD